MAANMTNGYHLENLVDEYSFMGHMCLLYWVSGGLNVQLWSKISFDQRQKSSCYLLVMATNPKLVAGITGYQLKILLEDLG